VSWVIIAIAGWITALAVVGLFAWALARSAAIGDREDPEQLNLARALFDRRRAPEDRRSATRPWAESSPGRRAEDALRQDLADAEDALKDAEVRLTEIEERRSA